MGGDNRELEVFWRRRKEVRVMFVVKAAIWVSVDCEK